MTETTENLEKRVRQFPSTADRVEQYALCLLFHLLVPWLPLGIALAASKRVEHGSLLLFLAIYLLSIGVSSRYQLFMGVMVVLSIVSSAFYGMTSGGIVIDETLITIGYAISFATVAVHAWERYDRHVANNETFWKFK
jgi:hypothetical protein